MRVVERWHLSPEILEPTLNNCSNSIAVSVQKWIIRKVLNEIYAEKFGNQMLHMQGLYRGHSPQWRRFTYSDVGTRSKGYQISFLGQRNRDTGMFPVCVLSSCSSVTNRERTGRREPGRTYFQDHWRTFSFRFGLSKHENWVLTRQRQKKVVCIVLKKFCKSLLKPTSLFLKY